MRRLWVLGAFAAASCATVEGPLRPNDVGTITLSAAPECRPQVPSTPLRVDPKHDKIVIWSVKNECPQAHSVTVGRTRADRASTVHYRVLQDCSVAKVAAGETGEVKCEIDTHCAPENRAAPVLYEYSVCIDGTVGLDPVIRVGGEPLLPGRRTAPQACPLEPSPGDRCEKLTSR